MTLSILPFWGGGGECKESPPHPRAPPQKKRIFYPPKIPGEKKKQRNPRKEKKELPKNKARKDSGERKAVDILITNRRWFWEFFRSGCTPKRSCNNTLLLQTVPPGERGSKIGNSESGYERVQKVWTQGAKVSQGSLAPSETCFAPVQPYFAPVQEAFCSLGPRDVLHPLVTTLGNFLFSTPSPRRLGLQHERKIRDGPNTTTTIIFPKKFCI